MDQGLVHKIAVLCKDYYVNRTIDDLFIFAGAEHSWWTDPPREFGSSRMGNVYGWIEGIKLHAAERLEKIVAGVSMQLVDDEQIPESDRNFIRRRLSLGDSQKSRAIRTSAPFYPKDVEQLLERLIKGLPRAMFPLKHRRSGLPFLEFDNEYDVQSLFHALMRPWIKDIRAEEYTPSYAGSSTRVDFLCAQYGIVIEVKYVRGVQHAKKIGDELIIDIAHYAVHPDCRQLWIVVFDPQGLIPNAGGLEVDLSGVHSHESRQVEVRTFVLSL